MKFIFLFIKRRSKSSNKISVPDSKTQKMSVKGFKKLKEFYSSIFEKITEKKSEVLFSSKFSFLKIYKETEEFLQQFSRKGKGNQTMNSTLFMVSLMKIHQFCIKNLLLDMQKKDHESYKILQSLELVLKENFNKFVSKIKSRRIFK